MFCGNCGKEVTAGAKFCPNCGAAVKDQPAPTEVQLKAPAVERMSNPDGNGTKNSSQTKRKMGLPKPFIIVAVVLVLLVALGVVLHLFGKGPESGTGNSTVPDWVEKIPYWPDEDGIPNMAAEEIPSTTYAELKKMWDPYFEGLGIPNNPDVEYHFEYYANRPDIFVFHQNENICSVISYEPGTPNQPDLPPTIEPVIARNDTDLYYLFYKRDSYYMILMTIPANPTTSYLTWPALGAIVVTDIKYSDLLNGTVDLEIVSIPEQAPDQTNYSKNKTVAENRGTVIVETDFYTVEIPKSWEKYCSCEKSSEAGGYILTFQLKEDYLEKSSNGIWRNGTLLELTVVPFPEDLPMYLSGEDFSYIGDIQKDGVSHYLVRHLLGDVAVKDQYQELVSTLENDIPSVLESITVNSGYTFSNEPLKFSNEGPHFLQPRDDMVLTGSFIANTGDVLSFFMFSYYSKSVEMRYNGAHVCGLEYQWPENPSNVEIFTLTDSDGDMTVEYRKDDDKVIVTGNGRFDQFNGEYYRYDEFYNIPFSSMSTNMVGGGFRADKYIDGSGRVFFNVGMNDQGFNWYSRYSNEEFVATDSDGNVVFRYLTVSQSRDFGDRFITVKDFCGPLGVEPLIIETPDHTKTLIYECENAYVIMKIIVNGNNDSDGTYMTDYVLNAIYMSNSDFYVTY